MANLKENNFHSLKIKINKDEYYDFFIYKDSYGSYSFNNLVNTEGLIAHINMCDEDSHDNNGWIFGKSDYTWRDAKSIENTLYNITYTGFDNGLFHFRKDRISNKDFFELFQKQKYQINGGDNRLKLHPVTGVTMLYEYPTSIEDCQLKLNGGFYQGFFKTECDKYSILPSHINTGDVWGLEFQLKKCELEKESNKTLNDKYPNNKGLFFYLGTRAENKWIYLYDKDDKDKLEDNNPLSPDDYVEDGKINKSDHIIGNFYDVDVEWTEPERKVKFDDVDDYVSFDYYDPSLYEDEPCDIENIDIINSYIDLPSKPKLIDETLPHIHMEGWCCNRENNNDDSNQNEDDKSNGGDTKVENGVEYKLFPFFRGCNCGKIYKWVATGNKVPENEKKDVNTRSGDYDYDDPFGDEYITGLDNINDGEDFDYIEPEIDISDFEYETDNGFKMSEGNQKYMYSDNKFLLFNRTCTGYTTSNWIEGNKVMFTYRKNNFKGNLFVLMNRTCTGYTVNTIDKLRDKENNKYNIYKDIYNNAFGLRIKDDGSIGYRLLTKDCSNEKENKVKMEEGYSNPNVIPNCEWCTVYVKIFGVIGGMKLYFYVNGKLVYITKKLPKFNFRELDEIYDKQEGVPYNISIGGGTQGLSETILQNYMLNPTRTYPIEEYFAGSFIGYMRDFKFYNSNMEYYDILKNYMLYNK
nr:MAG TPA: hypothetical protein [Bacteriophage sp.]